MTDGSTGRSAQGPRVVIVGGSMGGLLAGSMLHRAGCDVTVHERIGTELAERGVGIATHPGLHAALETLGLSIDEAHGARLEERITLGADGSILARYHLPQIQASWGHLFGLLRSNFPDERYIAGANFTRFEPHGEGVLAHFADGSSVEADLLVGADGVRSTVRPQLWPDAAPEFAGYVAWRGIVDENRLSAEWRDMLMSHFIVCLPPGEHVVGYPVAGPDGDLRPGKRRFNIVWYRLTTAETLRQMQNRCVRALSRGGDRARSHRRLMDRRGPAGGGGPPAALARRADDPGGGAFLSDHRGPGGAADGAGAGGHAGRRCVLRPAPHRHGGREGDRRCRVSRRRHRGASRRSFGRARGLRRGADPLRPLSGPLRPPAGHAYRDPRGGAQKTVRSAITCASRRTSSRPSRSRRRVRRSRCFREDAHPG